MACSALTHALSLCTRDTPQLASEGDAQWGLPSPTASVICFRLKETQRVHDGPWLWIKLWVLGVPSVPQHTGSLVLLSQSHAVRCRVSLTGSPAPHWDEA